MAWSCRRRVLAPKRFNFQRRDNYPDTGGRYKTLPMCPEWTREIWWPRAELNHRHTDFQSAALPTELLGHSDATSDNVNSGPHGFWLRPLDKPQIVSPLL